MKYLLFIIALFAALQTNAQNNIVYGAGINYTNGAPTFTPTVRTSRVAIDTVTGKWYHFNTPGGWQLIGNTIEEIAGCTAPAYTPGKGDSKVVINNCSPQPELYFYNGSAWVLVGGGSVYAGEGIRIENDTIILDSLYVLRFRTGDTTDLNAGAVSWNAAEQTLDVVINQGAVTGQMFQEVLYFTKNQTGVQINDGAVVMAAGTTGNSGKILIAPAIADGSVNSEYILGLATQNLPNGGEGMVTHFGKVRGIQTNGANYGETWVDGDVLYCSAATPGYLTKVLPTAPNLKIPIAIVIHAHPSNGTLFVRPSHFPDLAQINDVQLSSPTNGQVLTYNSTLSRWENATPANQLQTLSTDNTPGNISISSGNTITLNVNDADASATNELQTLSVAANTATLSNSGGSVTIAGAGINTVGTAGTTITITGTEVDGSTTNELQTLSLSGSDLSISGGNTVTLPATGLTGNGISPFVAQYNSTNTLDTTGIVWNGGRMGVGLTTTSPSARFHVRGQGNTSTTWTAQFHNSAGNNNALMIRDDGRVAVGFAAPLANFHVSTGSGGSLFIGGGGGGHEFRINSFSFTNDVVGTAGRLHFSNGTIGVMSFPTGNASGIIINPTSTTQTTTSAVLISTGRAITNGNIFSVETNRNITGAAVTSSAFNFTGARNLDPTNNIIGSIYTDLYFGGTFSPSAATNNISYNGIQFEPTINQRNATNAPVRGVLINPTLTSAPDFRGIEWTNSSGWGIYGAGTAKSYFAGNVAIGTTTQNASSAFEVASTTQGILFPRMTTAQRDLISTPADGLVIYNTSTNKLQVRAAGAWVDLH